MTSPLELLCSITNGNLGYLCSFTVQGQMHLWYSGWVPLLLRLFPIHQSEMMLNVRKRDKDRFYLVLTNRKEECRENWALLCLHNRWERFQMLLWAEGSTEGYWGPRAEWLYHLTLLTGNKLFVSLKWDQQHQTLPSPSHKDHQWVRATSLRVSEKWFLKRCWVLGELHRKAGRVYSCTFLENGSSEWRTAWTYCELLARRTVNFSGSFELVIRPFKGFSLGEMNWHF